MRAALLSLGAPLALVLFYGALFLLSYFLSLSAQVGGGADACSEAAFNAALTALGSVPKSGAQGGLSQSTSALELIVFGLASGCAFSHLVEFFTLRPVGSRDGERSEAAQAHSTLRLVVAASAAVFCMQALTYSALAFDITRRFCWLGSGPSAGLERVVSPLRIAYWAFSNPLIVVVVGNTVGVPPFLLFLSSGITCLCCLFGLGLEMVPLLSPVWVVLLILSFSCWTVCIYAATRVIRAAMRLAREISDHSRPLVILLSIQVALVWHAYPAIFLAAQLGVISAFNEQFALAILDGVAKLVVCNVAVAVASIYDRADEMTARKLLSLSDRVIAQVAAETRFRSLLTSFTRELRVPLSGAASTATSLVERASPTIDAGGSEAPADGLHTDACSTLSYIVTALRLSDEFLAFHSRAAAPRIATKTVISRSSDFGELDVSVLDLSHLSVPSLLTGKHGVLALLGKTALRHGIRLSFEFGFGAPRDVITDASRLRLVLLALCDMSLKICPRGGHVECRVSSIGWRSVPVTSARRGAAAIKASMPFFRVAFVDDGVGLLAIEIGELFGAADEARPGVGAKVAPDDEVLRIESERLAGASEPVSDSVWPQRRAGALGLARRVAEALGGTVGAKVEPNVGTMLYVDVPGFSSERALSACLAGAGGGAAKAILRRISSSSSIAGPAAMAADVDTNQDHEEALRVLAQTATGRRALAATLGARTPPADGIAVRAHES